MTINLLDKHGRPPIGARVYIEKHHALGTVVDLEKPFGTDCRVEIDSGSGEPALSWVSPKELKVIGPPELLQDCVLDECPLCEEVIRVKKSSKMPKGT